MAKQTVSQVIVRFLKERGVRYIFGVSGHSVFDFTDAVYQEAGVDFVQAQFEGSASYMADAYARAARQVGVCLGSSGPGVANLIGGISQAFKESSPVIALGADVDTHVKGKGASSWHDIPQEEMLRPITKMSVTLKAGEDALDVISEAYRQATTGRTGPVYVGIPEDLQGEEVEIDGMPWREPTSQSPRVDPELIRRAAAELAVAKAPTIIAGGGVYFGRAEAELQALAELLNAPVGTPHTQKGLISEEHPLALGVLGFGAFPFANRVCLESDVILAVGTTFSEGLTQGYGHRVIPEGARIIHVDADPGEIGKIYSPHIGIVGDAREVLRGIADELRRRGFSAAPSARVERIAEEKRAWLDEIARRGSDPAGPINHWHLYHALRAALPADTVVLGEGGTGELLANFPATCRIFQSGDYRAIGHGVSSSVGISHAFPNRRVVCVSGDGSLMMQLQELATVARTGLPIVFVVVHNDAYGSMKRDQIRQYDGRVIGTDLYIPDLPALAKSFGLEGERVERPAELEGAIRRAYSSGKGTVLDVVCPIEGI